MIPTFPLFISHIRYICISENTHTQTVPPKIVPFTFGDDPMNYDETISVACTVSGGDLPINFDWTLNGEPIDSHLEISIEKRGKRISSLMIDSLKAKHAGNYTCKVRNAAGIVEHSSKLIVNGSHLIIISARTLWFCIMRLSIFHIFRFVF